MCIITITILSKSKIFGKFLDSLKTYFLLELFRDLNFTHKIIYQNLREKHSNEKLKIKGSGIPILKKITLFSNNL